MAKLQSSCGWMFLAVGIILLAVMGALDWLPLVLAVAVVVGFCIRTDAPAHERGSEPRKGVA